MKTPTWESSAGALLAFVNAATVLLMTDLYTITMPDGAIYRTTSAESDLFIAGDTYISNKIVRGSTKQSVGITVDTMTLDVYAEDSTTFGSKPLIQSIANGVFDGAKIKVERAFFSQPGVAVGTIMMFLGRVGDAITERGHATIEVRSQTELFDVMIPTGVYQPSCRNTVFDLNCTLSRAAYALNVTAAVGTTGTRLNFEFTPGGGIAANYFALGRVKCLTGANAGSSRTIKAQSVGSGVNWKIEAISPWGYPIAIGDTFELVPGCDKTAATCLAKYANLSHFAAEPYIPQPDTIV